MRVFTDTIGLLAYLWLVFHPFQDGNGRLSRILTTLLLLHVDYAYVLYSSLENVIDNSKQLLSGFLADLVRLCKLRTPASKQFCGNMVFAWDILIYWVV